MCRLGFAVAIFVMSLPLSGDELPDHIQIGGPRKATAIVTEKDGDLIVTVEMRPVRCFDKATNALINREKSEAYGEIALGRYLRHSAHDDVRTELRGKAVDDAGLVGERFRLTMRVPKNGVSFSAVSSASDRNTISGDSASLLPGRSILDAKEDYITTTESLARSLSQDILAPPQERSDEQAFLGHIAEKEEAGSHSFDAIRAEVKKDKLLLSIERKELLSLIDGKEEAFLEQLRMLVKQWDKRPVKSNGGGKE